MPERLRGQEVQVQFLVDGDAKAGSFHKVTDFRLTPRDDLSDSDFIGQPTSEPDHQHHGFDFSFSNHEQDPGPVAVMLKIQDRLNRGLPYPKVTIIAIRVYRELGQPPKTLVMSPCVVKMDSYEVGGRKDYVRNTWSGKCRDLQQR